MSTPPKTPPKSAHIANSSREDGQSRSDGSAEHAPLTQDNKPMSSSVSDHSSSEHSIESKKYPKGLRPHPTEPSLVPKGLTIGLAIFALSLSLSGYAFRLAIGDDVETVLRHAAMLVPAFVIGIPLLFWLGSLVMNKVTGSSIQRRNAITLGLLTSCVAMLWLMGTYS